MSEYVTTLIDPGSENCYIDAEFADRTFGVWREIPHEKSSVGLGGEKIYRYGPFEFTFKTKYNNKIYEALAKTYIAILPQQYFVILSGNWITASKLPVHNIMNDNDKVEY